MTEHVDVVIVGAGISGISAAWHLQDRCPSKSYAILERRDDLGGTWDLFKYPGIRSDSDMFTLGFRFKPWDVGDSRSPTAPRSRPTSRKPPRERHRQAHPVRPQGDRRRLVRRRQSLDVHRRQRRTSSTRSPARSCSRAAATTTTTRATRRSSKAPTTSRAPSCTRSTGRRISTTPARRSSSSAAAPPR